MSTDLIISKNKIGQYQIQPIEYYRFLKLHPETCEIGHGKNRAILFKVIKSHD
jgi:hypothetical protein